MFFLFYLLIPYKSIGAMMVYFISIIKQFNDGEQDYLMHNTQYDYKTNINPFWNYVCGKLLSLNKWIKLSEYEPDINQTNIRSSRKFLHHTDEKIHLLFFLKTV